MLFKYMEAEKRARHIAEKRQRSGVSTMKYTTLTSASVSPRIHRKVIRGSAASKRARTSTDLPEVSDLSNDSGLGLDHQLEVRLATRTSLPYSTNTTSSTQSANNHTSEEKRRKLELSVEVDDINEEFCFPDITRGKNYFNLTMPGRGRANSSGTPHVTLSSSLSSATRDNKTQLVIICQPEQQHRARYQTEGSRGAVKDRTGNGFPVVKLVGYNKPTTLQVFIGTDLGRVAPHMFYQACRVSGKNSTPCVERKVDGTVVIEIDLDPSKDMMVTCDCVGILKERNVDVEHRFPDQSGSRNKKKSTRCRMVFRTIVTNPDGLQEVIQVCSQPIVCTQPPGIPEICKKSLSSCPVTGGLELFILGKNFLKDTRVVFQQADAQSHWEESVVPDKEFLQQTHLVCVVPAYRLLDITEPVNVRIFVTSSGKTSDPQTLVYLPVGAPPMLQVSSDVTGCSTYLSSVLPQALLNGTNVVSKSVPLVPPSVLADPSSLVRPTIVQAMKTNFFDLNKKEGGGSGAMVWPSSSTTTTSSSPSASSMLSKSEEERMMPPPPGLIPISTRRSSVQMMVSEAAEHELKSEMMEELSQHSVVEHEQESLSPTDLSMKTPSDSLMVQHLVDQPNKYYTADHKTFSLKVEGGVYDEVAQDRQLLTEALLNPPPAKIPARGDYGVPESEFLRGPGISYSAVLQNESSQSGFEPVVRTRSGSFSSVSTVNETSMGGYETYSRSRTNSMSQSYEHSRPYEQRSMLNVNVYEQSQQQQPQMKQDVQPEYFVQTRSNDVSVSTPATRLDQLVCSFENGLINTSAHTSSSQIDAFVNHAADNHMNTSPKSEHSPAGGVTSSVSSTDSYMMTSPPQQQQPQQQQQQTPTSPGKTLIFDEYVTSQCPVVETQQQLTEVTSKPAAIATTTTVVVTIAPTTSTTVPVKDMSNCAQKIGDMYVPAGPAPPITGMVPQEMVKMTDNDLISYINPSCFDQV